MNSSVQSTCHTFLAVDGAQFVTRLVTNAHISKFVFQELPESNVVSWKLDLFYRVRPTAPHGCHIADRRVPGI
jgi:hypothetical protein